MKNDESREATREEAVAGRKARQEQDQSLSNEETSKILRNAKILQIVFLGFILIYIIILVVLPQIGFTPIFAGDDFWLTRLVAVFGLLAAIDITLGYFLPQRIVKRTEEKVQRAVYAEVILRISFFESIAIYGIMLGICGAGWEITVFFFVVAAGTLIHTFPTEERLKKMIRSNKNTGTAS